MVSCNQNTRGKKEKKGGKESGATSGAGFEKISPKELALPRKKKEGTSLSFSLFPQELSKKKKERKKGVSPPLLSRSLVRFQPDLHRN